MIVAESEPVSPALDMAVRSDIIVGEIILVVALAIAWYVIRACARHGWPDPPKLYLRLDPQIQALYQYLLKAPATVIYTAIWTGTTLIVVGSPAEAIELIDRFNSTNILGVITDPFRTMITSALLVWENGLGYGLYVVVFFLIVARLEQRLGTPRTLIIWVASHVIASFITIGIEVWHLHSTFERGIISSSDIGVSYVMVGSMAAYGLFVTNPWKWWYLIVFWAALILPTAIDFTLDELGHLLAATIGLLTALLLRRWGVRPRFTWRELATVSPRPLIEPGRVSR